MILTPQQPLRHFNDNQLLQIYTNVLEYLKGSPLWHGNIILFLCNEARKVDSMFPRYDWAAMVEFRELFLYQGIDYYTRNYQYPILFQEWNNMDWNKPGMNIFKCFDGEILFMFKNAIYLLRGKIHNNRCNEMANLLST